MDDILCDNIRDFQIAGGGTTSLSTFDTLIADGTMASNHTSSNLRFPWSLDRYLYEKLKENLDIVNGNSLMNGFIAAKQNTAIGQFYEIRRKIREAYQLAATDQATLMANIALIEQYLLDIAAIDAQLEGGVSSQDSITLLNDRAAKATAVQAATMENTGLLAVAKGVRYQKACDLLDEVENIAVQHVYGQNEKDVYALFLNTVAAGIVPTDAQVNQIKGIAYQCHAEGGPAVFMARALYGGWTSIAVPDVDCPPDGLIDNTGEEIEEGGGWKVYPNPTNGQVTIELSGPLGETASLSLFDAFGKIAGSHAIPAKAGRFTVNMDGLPTGVYFLKLVKKGQPVLYEKIHLIR